MLPQFDSYPAIRRQFRWAVPAYFNIGVNICDRWASDPNRLALIHDKRDGTADRYSFADIRRLSNKVANLFRLRGLRTGDRVGILLPQQPETAVAHVATYKVGAIAVPLFALFGVDALKYRLADSGTRMLVTDSNGARKIAGIRADLPQLETVFCTDTAGG
ncbi:MAG: AMP-binding protein, partial [Burkholderiales bacterium]